MSAKNIILITLLNLYVLHSHAQSQQDSSSTTRQVEKQVESQKFEAPIYQLFPTDNYWTFIKLDTRNGKMWQVHFTISNDGYDGELILNPNPLVWSEEEINGRFTLYSTKNMFNFILLDQVNGKTYQVQWNNDKEKRFVNRIY
jgi:uncharacterized protein YtpQ (UPF0354 family)